MHDYEVRVFDEKVGTVAGRVGDVVLVQHGTLRKHRRGLPSVLVDVDDDERVVRATVSKDMIETAPEADGDDIDERAVLAHYGLAGGYEQPETLGYGELNPDDPAWSAEQQEIRTGVQPAAAERAEVRSGLGPGEGALDTGPPSPGVTGGDRRRDARH